MLGIFKLLFPPLTSFAFTVLTMPAIVKTVKAKPCTSIKSLKANVFLQECVTEQNSWK